LAHILHNIGFSDIECLSAHTAAWEGLYSLIRPDLVVFDHSPFALLASRGLAARRVVVGSGFFIPPDQTPWPSFRFWEPTNLTKLQAAEDDVCGRANAVLQKRGRPKLDRISQIYSEVDDTFLTTYPDLDHYPSRAGARYRGCEVNNDGIDLQWSDGPGKKIFGYLKPFPALPALLEELNRLRLPTLLFIQGADAALRDRFSSPTLQFVKERLNMQKAAAVCDVGLTNGTLNTTAALLRAGKPVLMIPLMLEQGIIARKVSAQGAGVESLGGEPILIKQNLQRMVTEDHFTGGARRLAAKLAEIDVGQEQREMFARLDELLGNSRGSVSGAKSRDSSSI
jgi:hypothetical protein